MLHRLGLCEPGTWSSPRQSGDKLPSEGVVRMGGGDRWSRAGDTRAALSSLCPSEKWASSQDRICLIRARNATPLRHTCGPGPITHQAGPATKCSSNYTTVWKSQPYRDSKYQWLPAAQGKQGGMKRWSSRDSPGTGTMPYDTVIMDTHHRTRVKTRGMHNPEREPDVN